MLALCAPGVLLQRHDTTTLSDFVVREHSSVTFASLRARASSLEHALEFPRISPSSPPPPLNPGGAQVDAVLVYAPEQQQQQHQRNDDAQHAPEGWPRQTAKRSVFARLAFLRKHIKKW